MKEYRNNKGYQNKNNKNISKELKGSKKEYKNDWKKEKVKEKIVEDTSIYEDKVEGRNSCLELLESGRDINKIFVSQGEKHGSIHKIIAMAKENKVIVVEVERNKLDEMSEGNNHQGVIAVVPPFDYASVDDILNEAKQRGEDPFIILLDGIEDPHNLGSIIRTAETAGVHGVIIPKHRAVTVNATVSKVSSGAIEYMKVARVTNLVDTIKYLKQNDIWVYGTDGQANTYYYNQDLKGGIALVIGSEGFGMSRLVKENCDVLLKIPMQGKVTSLNASVSAGIVIYEAVKQKQTAK